MKNRWKIWVRCIAPRPACARSHGRLRKFKRAAARVGVSEELASVLRLAVALEGGAATLSVSEVFNDIFDLGT